MTQPWKICDTKENNKIVIAIEYKRLIDAFDIVHILKLLNNPQTYSNGYCGI